MLVFIIGFVLEWISETWSHDRRSSKLNLAKDMVKKVMGSNIVARMPLHSS